jgi:two-component system, NarL family, nitrate/nitrite response regulator NarL
VAPLLRSLLTGAAIFADITNGHMHTGSTFFACESQPVVVEGLIRIFEPCADLKLVGYAAEVAAAAQEIQARPVDILLLGQPPTTRSILPLLAQVRDAHIPSRIVLWVAEMTEMDAFRALQMGARGVVTRVQPVSSLLECLRTVARGAVWIDGATRSTAGVNTRRGTATRLTRREREIIECVCKGMKNREIAEALSITAGTVKVHLMHIFEKTGAKDRFQLALQGRQLLGAGGDEAAALTPVGEL